MLGALLACALAAKPVIIPQPNEVTTLGGDWTLDSSAQIGYDASVEGAKEVAETAAEQLRKATGYALQIVTTVPVSGVYFGASPALTGKEEYTMLMTASLVEVHGSTHSALFYGLQTLLQILPSEVLKNVATEGVEWKAPIMAIHDQPRFQWRGVMLDVARHFQTVKAVKSVIEGMARYKMNTLHMHLTDDQGWRIESKKFPNLTEIGSIRKASPKHWDRNHLDNIPYGPFFYTQEEIKDIIAFGKARGVRIIPEIEMPGHSICALSAFPHLSCTGGPFEPRCLWGVETDVCCAGNDDTLKFLEELLDEMIDLFDSEYIHTGGDECPKTRWQKCPRCATRMQDQGLTTYDQLQAWFTAHFAQYLSAKGKKLIGWDEITQGGLPDGTTVMVWRSASAATEAAKLGHDVVMTLTSAMYFDYPQFSGTDSYEYIGSTVSSLHNVYSHDPSGSLDDDHKKYVIGVQGNLWGEYIWDQTDLEYKGFPRIAALAEIGWTDLKNKDWNRFLTSMVRVEYNRLNILDRNAAPIQIGMKANWQSGELPTEWVNMLWPVTGSIGETGYYEIAFIWRGGANGLKIKNVKLWIMGVIDGSDSHESYTFEESQGNIYSIHSLLPATVSKVSISADVCCDGGTDSYGDIYIYKV